MEVAGAVKIYKLLAVMLAVTALAAGCGQEERSGRETQTEETGGAGSSEQAGLTEPAEEAADMTDGETVTNASLPEELAQIPREYFEESDSPGTLVELTYDTYESMSYEEQDQVLKKRAIVYLPYGYSEDEQYNVFYLMHGGWSNETTYLGTPERPNEFKNVLDNGIADGKIRPMIVVCPTYNNESESDSSSYSLALRLTENYHNELLGDLIPAVEGTYSTYAEDTTAEGIRVSRDHRAFCGFSMGSVATWRTFQYCLDDFRYFLPSSGSLTADVEDGTFRYANNEKEGNLYFLEQEGGTHNGDYAMEYFYNGLCWIWQ